MPTFPQSASVYIAPGANPADPSTYQFTDITTDVRLASKITIQVGRQDEISEVATTGHTLTLDNRTGNYSPRNVLSTWYGQLRKGTPVQTRVKLIDDTFGRTVGSGLGTDPVTGQAWTADGDWSANGTVALCAIPSANFFSTANLLTVLGDDVDILKVTSLSAVTTGSAWVDATVVRYQDGNNYVRVHTEYGLSGVIAVKVTRVSGGVATDIYATTGTSVTYAAGTKIRTRVQAIGPTYRIKVWLDSGSEPAAWTASVNDSATVVRGNAVGLYEWRVAGNTNAGTLTATLYEYRVDVIRATTPVPEWPTRWNQAQTDATAPITGAGILRRLSQGQTALRSPMYRQLLQWSPAGFWPLEDGSGATSAASAVARVPAATCSDVAFGSGGPPGAASAITLNNATSSIKALVQTSPATATGYAGMFMFKLSAIPGSDSTLAYFTATGTVVLWQIVSAAGGSVKLNGYDSSGTAVVAAGPYAWTTVDPTQWCAMELQTTVSGGTVTWQLAWNQVSNPIFSNPSGTYSGTASRLTGWTATGAASTSYSMAWLGANTLPFITSTFYNVESGYAGELAGNRLTRLCAEEGVPLIVMGDPNATAAMGAQAPSTFVDLITECEQADQGLLHERGAGLGFLTSRFRTNAPVAMALDFAQGHLASPPEPVDDDQRLINQIKLTRKNGSEYTTQNDASILLSGTYTDERTVNVAVDGQLPNQAGWRLHLGTIDELRWPKISLRLHGTPSLIPAWCGIRIGSRITIANPPSQVAGSQLDLLVEGWTETIGVFTWDVDIVCSPAPPWDVGVYDGSNRYDLRTCTMTAAAAAGVTSLGFTIVNDEQWSTTSTPYGLMISGELVTVTSMGARTGTGPYAQTATVTRAVNGISKTLPANAEVHIATPGRFSV